MHDIRDCKLHKTSHIIISFILIIIGKEYSFFFLFFFLCINIINCFASVEFWFGAFLPAALKREWGRSRDIFPLQVKKRLLIIEIVGTEAPPSFLINFYQFLFCLSPGVGGK